MSTSAVSSYHAVRTAQPTDPSTKCLIVAFAAADIIAVTLATLGAWPKLFGGIGTVGYLSSIVGGAAFFVWLTSGIIYLVIQKNKELLQKAHS